MVIIRKSIHEAANSIPIPRQITSSGFGHLPNNNSYDSMIVHSKHGLFGTSKYRWLQIKVHPKEIRIVAGTITSWKTMHYLQ